MKKTKISLTINSKIKDAIIFEKEMKQIIKNFAEYFGIKKQIIVDVSLVSPQKIKRLNKEYRNKDYVTDILSFGFDDSSMYDELPFIHLGELVICWNKVVRQAKYFGHSIKREFCYLFTHGLVHLAGYDHEIEEERIQMNKMVDDIFNPLKITRKEGTNMTFEKLKDLLKYTYTPYSKFPVAAILIGEDGKEYYGVNVENAAYPSGLCAERSAMFGSVAYGGKVGSFKEIHIISGKNEIISPCAGCRQVMTEFMPLDAKVYQYSNDGKQLRVNTVEELVPYSIRAEEITIK
ncbi:cytidine deaminase [Mycoplasma sp. 4404]|uniref:cytidine deaminase n=1 Tax=unclassified Mycoplasma TaxID=2683645 RepID=UPI002B1E4173|nr:cytidine deaminase [Mycoplasma sp. 4404]MEA4162463.1 cytidine deaminase [Mycoplasma sp. 4404]